MESPMLNDFKHFDDSSSIRVKVELFQHFLLRKLLLALKNKNRMKKNSLKSISYNSIKT